MDVVDDIASALNKTKCRATGERPFDINFSNAESLWDKLYGDYIRNPAKKKTRYKVGYDVRISLKKPIFEKGYLPTFTDEIFNIDKVVKNKPDLYFLNDHNGEKIEGRFYAPELTKVSVDKNTSYRIEKIHGTKKGKNGEKQYKVSFIGYPNKFYWISERDLDK
jgi:hypothetical protein